MKYRKPMYKRRLHRRMKHTYKKSGYSYMYFDTFQMELMLDRLHEAVNILDGINRLNQNIFSAPAKGNSVDTLRDSLDTISTILPGEVPQKQLSGVSNALGLVSKMGGLQGMVESMAPMLKALTSADNTHSLK